ncbi:MULTISPECIES: MFS transporter [Pseudomonadaceae]|uniref:Sugar phosphate permease n=3 Tax=Pseudomonadaceae TaxID=135621 RepID=A0A3D9ECA8_ECTOL|nr:MULTISPECIES: MFS transporter [Pseudomonas]KIZ49764.1 MFS transporter [Pseudomonas oryzihabitans]KTT48128.1 MFS transporter [Pseudomonas psychrotolerans]MBH3331498.1 MFS transporter [Pseudomonas oryzihabitans]NMZ47130.1 MFS transporter [Pseudomonas oryzihabitans]NMZ64946.1 MFS transporter [Pseudomonas oryzihabitans]
MTLPAASSLHPETPTAAWKPQPLSSADVRYATWIAFFAWVFAVYDFILFGTLLPVMGGHFNWSEAEQAELATWVALGGAIIAFAIGPLVDRIGRRGGIIVTIGGTALCSALTALCAGMGKVPLVLVRSVAGLGYAEEGVNATYLTEVYAASDDPRLIRRRGFIYSLVQSGWPIGALIAAGLTALLLPHIGWQGCFVFAAVPAFVIAVLARKLKESPQFQVHARIQRLRREGQEQDARSLAREYGVDYEEHAKAGVAMAFKGQALRPTLVLSLAILLNWSAIQVFSVLGTSVIVSVHKLSFENSLWILVLSNAVGFIGYLFHGWLGDRIGRRNTVALGWMCGGLAFFAMLQAPSQLVPVVALYSLGLFFLTGPYSAMLFFMGESFPTSIRATGGAIVHAMGPLGAILAGLGITSVLGSGGQWHSAALWFGALPCFLSGLVMWAARHVEPTSLK